MGKIKKNVWLLSCCFIALLIFTGNIKVLSKESGDTESSAQTSVIYIAEKKQSVDYIPREQINTAQSKEVNTGDSIFIWKYIGMVISSAFILMLIIKKQKGEKENENS